jgi:hypothetical protein
MGLRVKICIFQLFNDAMDKSSNDRYGDDDFSEEKFARREL